MGIIMKPQVSRGENSKKYLSCHQLGVSKNNDTPKSSILIGFSIINHPFWVVYHPYFWVDTQLENQGALDGHIHHFATTFHHSTNPLVIIVAKVPQRCRRWPKRNDEWKHKCKKINDAQVKVYPPWN